jgi:hypothetical protein
MPFQEQSRHCRLVMAMGRQMAEQSPEGPTEIAARVWSTYLMLHADVDENDQRRASLTRYIRKRYEAGDRDEDELIMAGLVYLRMLDSMRDSD